MKVAITADIHLKTMTETPERFHALENIFQQLKQREISNLFIAGDLFDRESFNYNDLDELCRKYSDIYLTIIPGNHDLQIEKRFFTATNIEIIREPFIKEIDELSFLFIPCDSTKTIDEVLTEFIRNNRLPERWILIGHGDYITRKRELNSYEPGFYMPVLSKTINKHNPLRVILGHIHKPSEFGKVIYPGSPCGLDITETGKRSFIIYDTLTDSVNRSFVQTDTIYLTISILVFPVEEEISSLRDKFNQMVKSWGLTEDELKKVKLRFTIKGWTNDLPKLKNGIIELLKSQGVSLYDTYGPNISKLKILRDIDSDRISILEKVRQKIDSLPLQSFLTSKDEILEEAMRLIFE
ncbi:MAG: metallophosphoesterase [Candidatus Omnitrophica bacterium]|nr:metallophosphoesterase [Candidatus Omnitrophota bacterium]